MDEKPLRIVIVACEPSADRQGAALLEALRARVAPRPVQAWGIGGAYLRAAGMTVRHDSDPWATIGLVSALTHFPLRPVGPGGAQAGSGRRPAGCTGAD